MKAEHRRTDAFELVMKKTLECTKDCTSKSIYTTENHSCIFIARTDSEAEVPILWPPDAKSQLIGQDPDTGEDSRQ